MAEGNDITMLPAYPAEGQFVQEIPSNEDIDEDIQAEVSGDTLGYVKGISRCVE